MDKKVGLIVGLLLLFSLVVVVGSGETKLDSDIYLDLSNNISNIIGKEEYRLGEDIYINVSMFKNSGIEVSITHGKETYRYVGIKRESIIFTPKERGNYTVMIINLSDRSAVYSTMFNVEENLSSVVPVFTDKKVYRMGELVYIYTASFNDSEYELSVVTKKSVYKFLGVVKSPLTYNPPKVGEYEVSLRHIPTNTIKGYNFTVEPSSKETREAIISISTEKKRYLLGETAYINLNFTRRKGYELSIIEESNIYYYLGIPESPLPFTPKSVGNYTVRLEEGNSTLASHVFEVVSEENVTKGKIRKELTEKKYNYYFDINEDAEFIIDFSERVKGKKSLMDRIFGRSPIREVSAYIENHTQDESFNLTIRYLGNESFFVMIKNNLDIKAGVYTLIAEARLDSERINETRVFQWGNLTREEPINVSENVTINITHINISRYINYSFRIDEDAVFEVDFTERVKAERDFLEAALRKSMLDSITSYVEGEEYNEDFNLTIEHIEFDRFLVRVKQNNNIKLDVYKLVVIASSGEQLLREEILFNWGLTNASEIVERVNSKKVIRLVPINETNITADVRQANVTSINVTKKVLKKVRFRVNLKDRRDKKLFADIRVYDKKRNLVREIKKPKGVLVVQQEQDIEEGEYNVEIVLEKPIIKRIEFTNLSIRGALELRIDNVSTDNIKTVAKEWVKAYAIDPSRLNFTNATVTSVAKGYELYKCKEWNFSEQRCYGSWQKIMDLVPGHEYNFTLTREDPGYAETGLASINTKKSMYHPNEVAEIIVVVLDKEGHLVSNANVILNITNPDNAVATYSTDDGTITETQRGIYEANHSSTSLEGNYSMIVYATGDNVNNTMVSYFTVKEYYEFDILRTTPVTTDPWGGAFDSSIRIISYTNATTFDFSEILPINFTVTDDGSATETVMNSKKILTWRNLGNNSVVSYSALPPLVTPELYDIGPAYVLYGLDRFYEARSWYIAIDPVNNYTVDSCTIEDDDGGSCTPSYLDATGDSFVTLTTDGTTVYLTVYFQQDLPNGAENISAKAWIVHRNSFNARVQDEEIHYNGSGAWVQQGEDLAEDGNGVWVTDSRDISDIDTEAEAEDVWLQYRCTSITLGTSKTCDVDLFLLEITYSMDTTPPEITLISPANGTWQISRSINFTFNATTNDDFANCSLWTNESIWGWKQSNSSTVINATVHGINETFDSDGDFLWNIECYDTLGNSNFSQRNFTVRIDSLAPNMSNLTYPPNGSTVTSTPTDFNFTATDNRGLANCSLWANFSGSWQQNVTVFNPPSGTETNITVSPPDGIFIWNVQCVDNAGNSDFYDTNHTLTVDTSGPTVNLESPANNSVWVTAQTVDFTFNVSDLSELINCSLIINDKINKTNETAILKDTSGQSFSQTLENGDYNWSINCTDVNGFAGASDGYNLTVDYQLAPSIITIVFPANGSYINNDPVSLNATTNENSTCKYSSNKSFNYTTQGTIFDTTGNQTHSTNLGSLAEGNYVYYIKCNNTYGLINNDTNQGETNFTVDRTIPSVNLNYPINNYNTSPISINFNWTAIDYYIDANLGCNLTINGAVNRSNINSNNNTPTNYSVYLGDGNYYWNVTCWDDATNVNTSATRIVNVDGTSPTIVEDSISASPSTVSVGGTVSITVNVTDNVNVSTVFVNVSEQTSGTSYWYQMYSIGNNQYQYNFTDTSTADIYDYYIWANDTASPVANTQQSTTDTFEVVGTRTIIGVQTVNDSYKFNQDVNLTSTVRWDSPSQGTANFTTDAERDFSQRTCTNVWGYDCDGTFDDTYDSCPTGGEDALTDVTDIYLNATVVRPGETIEVKCEYRCDTSGSVDNTYIYYRNSSSGTWRDVTLDTKCDSTTLYNETIELTLDNIEGVHQIRCIVDRDDLESTACAEDGGTGSNTDDFDNDDINITIDIIDNDENTSYVNFSNIGTNYSQLTDIDIHVEIGYYNNNASSSSGNNNADLEVSLYDGDSYSYTYTCSANSITGSGSSVPANCSKKVKNSTILDAWKNSVNRSIRIRALYFDSENGYSVNDGINVSGVFVQLETPSKLENYGILNLTAMLLMQIHYKNGSEWQTKDTIYNQSTTVAVNETLDLSTLWDSWNTDNNVLGAYRVYVSLTDSQGNVLQNEDDTYINDSYEFSLDYLRITVESPQNNSVVDATNFWANITLNYASYPSGSWCAYSLDGNANITMQNDSSTHFYNFTTNTLEGTHNITFYCNDSEGDVSYTKTSFNATDQTGPIINLTSPVDSAEEPDGNITFIYNVTDKASNISSCTLEFQFSDNQTNNTIAEGVPQYFYIYNLPNGGPYYWRIYCYDNSSNSNVGYSTYYDFIVGADTDIPVIKLKEPIEGENTTNNDVTFIYRVNDLTSDIANCSLILNNRTNQTNYTIVEEGSFPYNWNNFTVIDMPDGNYTWGVNCTDDSNNANEGNSSTRSISVQRDLDAPSITLITPVEGYNDTDGEIIFYYNVTDDSSNIANCSLIINGTINKTTPNPSKDQTNSFNVTGFSDGDYNWQINCTDDSFDLNMNSSEIRNFSVSVLLNLVVDVYTDKTTYEQGTQANETVTVTTDTKDVVGNPINASVTMDVIIGNTTLRWWNSSWRRRKPIYINETRGLNRTNVSIEVNVTGIGGNISSCVNEIRVIRNYSMNSEEIPVNISDGDDSNYCTILFYGNVTANAFNQNNYYVYYNNSDSANPNYGLTFNHSSIELADGGEITGTPVSGGSYSDTWSDDTSYWYFGDNGNNNINEYAVLTYNISSLNISEEGISSLEFGLTYCHSGEDTTPDCDGDDPIDGTQNGDQNVEVYNYESSTWTDIGNLNTANGEFEVTGSWSATGNLLEYVNDTSYEIKVRYELDYNQSPPSQDSWLVLDYATLTVNFRAVIVSTSVGITYELINRSQNDTGDDGSFSFNLTTNGLELGWYSAVTLASATDYTDDYNFTFFNIIVDQTASTVNLVSPDNGKVSGTNSMIFYYNVSDALSGIANCSLIINNTINQTNSSIAEETTLNFSLTNLVNSDYLWTVNCTDDSTNNNVGTDSARTFTIAVDTTPPTVSLISPIEGYNDTNGNILFSYNVTDDLTSTADCELYINNTLNDTQLDVQTDGSTQTFTVDTFTDGEYSWFVNCTDDSLARNSNISETRNFTVTLDTLGPAINLEYPGDNAHLTNENVTFRYNVTDTIAEIVNCSLIINGSINVTNTTVTEGISQNFTLYYLDGSYSWSVNCTDNSENFNVNASETRTLLVATDNDPPQINLVSPPNDIKVSDVNVTFIYNVSDLASGIANCSLIIDNRINQTNSSIEEGKNLNFTSTLADIYTSDYNSTSDAYGGTWQSSPENATQSPDNFPATDLTSNENELYVYNFTGMLGLGDIQNIYLGIRAKFDPAGVGNDELALKYSLDNGTTWLNLDGTPYNATNVSIQDGVYIVRYYEITSGLEWENLTNIYLGVEGELVGLPDNDEANIDAIWLRVRYRKTMYNWSVNCTDDSPNNNVGNSSARNITITTDKNPPEVSLLAPMEGYNDTNGDVLFTYTVNDYSSGIANCSLIINEKINKTNTTVEENVPQNFTVSGFGDGNYSWSVNCTDNSSNYNTGNSSTLNFTVVNDNLGPIITLTEPINMTWESNGNRTFYYNVTDAVSGIANCSLIINGKLNQTNTTGITEETRENFTVTGLEDGLVNWSINCTDNSENFNTNASAMWILNVTVDFTKPSITLISPDNNTLDTDGERTFSYNVTDTISNITSCTLYIDGQSYTNTSVQKGVTQYFTVTDLTTQTYYWNISCTDASESQNQNISENRNLTVTLDLQAPDVALITPPNYTQEVNNTVTFSYNVSDTSTIANCSLILNDTVNLTNSSITKNVRLNFTLDMPNGTYEWSVNCTDTSEDVFVGASETRIVIVGPDTDSPNVTLISPQNGIEDIDGDVVFEYNVTDFASGIANCSLIFNNSINQTNSSVEEDITHRFTLEGVSDGNYTWQVNCTDNSTNNNLGSSEVRNITIGRDTTPPDVSLIGPANNSIVNSDFVTFEYTASDYASNITNCSLLINDIINQTNNTINESASNFFYLTMDDGNYNWSINCTDYYNNSRLSYKHNFTVFKPRQIYADIFANDTSYEQGSTALITVNVTNSSNDQFDANVYIDIIKGNTTIPWWDDTWNYRIQIDINSTNVTRHDELIEYAVNFTDILTSEIGITDKTFDNNSIRVIEFVNNESVEVYSQFERSAGFNKITNAYGTVYWLLNGTTEGGTIRYYFIYFDIEENGVKTAADYSSYKPTLTFSGSSKSIDYDGSSTNADYLSLSYQGESFTTRFYNGENENITNQQNIDYTGAGSIYNITINNDRITNLYDSIVPIAIYDNYFLNANSTSIVESGPVFTKIRIPGNINVSSGSYAELNYTIWFTGNEIMVKAELYVNFVTANSGPQNYFNNLWFAYLFDNRSDWSSYINEMNSSSFNQTHRYHAPTTSEDTTNKFNAGDWYSEYDSSKGSINFYIEEFLLNGLTGTKGVISLDDYWNPALDKTSESDGVGFNYNSDTTINANDNYSLTVWMIFSGNTTYLRAIDLKEQVENPANITKKGAQTLINRTTNETTNGLFKFNWSTVNKDIGNYTATVIANKTYYLDGIDYSWFEITKDTTEPVVTAISPEGWINTADTTFYYNVSDTNSVANCSLVLNNKINQTNRSITNNAQNTLIVYNISEGPYNWSVNCTDSAGNIGNSSVKNITVDLTEPSINLSAPNNTGIYNFSTLEFNFTAFDNRDTNLTCNLTIDSKVNRSNLNASNGSVVNITVTNLTQAVHNWNVTCWDDANNTNTSETWQFTVDIGPPSITLNSPGPSSWDNIGNITFIYTPSDLSDIDNCSLIIDNKINQTNTSITNDEQNNFTVTDMGEKVYNWTVNCTDITGDTGTTAAIILYIDKTNPSINLTAPADGYVSPNSTVRLNFTARDNMDTTLECNVTVNGTVNNTNQIVAPNGTNSNYYNVSGLTDGFFFWNITCWDSANNTNTSVTRNFTVAEPPKIALGNPENETKTKDRNITFSYTPEDNSGNISNCSLILNNKVNITNSTINEGAENKFNVTNLLDNQYNWTVNCTDESGNTGTNLSEKVFYIDNLGPSIILNEPYDGQTFNQNDIYFNFTPTDQFGLSTNLSCNLTLDGVVNVSNISVISGQDNITTIENLSLGDHSWNVTCMDDLNNSNTSLTASFVINQPDLTLNTTDIVFNDSNPKEGENITISATVYNTGGIPASNVLVQFYNESPTKGGIQIDGNQTVPTIDTGGNVTVNVTWIPTLGTHEIWVVVDPDNTVSEKNESNNNASTNITISSWFTMYGNSTGDLFIQDISNQTVFSWLNISATGGNIFAVDLDNDIEWNSLKALGRNMSDSISMDDFEDVDNVLKSTNYSDSINITYTYNGNPRNTTTFYVFNNVIQNVSIANSTNNSNFVTGILWDTSDDADGEYSGTEDLVFVSEINPDSQGKYGIYDYEIRIPSELKKYKTADIYSVVFYVELR
jgi:hypothetical protein